MNTSMTQKEKYDHNNHEKNMEIEKMQKYLIFYEQARIEWNNHLIAAYKEKKSLIPYNFSKIVQICAEKTAYEKLLMTDECYVAQETEKFVNLNAHIDNESTKYMSFCNKAMLEWKNYFTTRFMEKYIPIPNDYQELVIICAEKTANEQLEQLNHMTEKTSQK